MCLLPIDNDEGLRMGDRIDEWDNGKVFFVVMVERAVRSHAKTGRKPQTIAG